jgi:tetratricopeptide (TPR) repeat protein
MSAFISFTDPRVRERLRRALASLELAALTRRPWALVEAHREAARAYREAGALASAAAMLEQALRWSPLVGSVDARADLLCEWVELLAEQSDAFERLEAGSGRPARERARDAVFEASQVAARVADPRWEVTVLLRLSDVLDRFGDRDDATLLQMRALQLTVGHRPEPPRPELADAAAQRRH